MPRPAKQPAPLEAAYRAKLESSALDAADARRLKFKLHTAESARALALPHAAEGFQIPYFALDGSVSPFWRYRYLADTRTGFEKLAGVKPLRYTQPARTAPELYVPPLIKWADYLANDENRLLFTEGELKAACATKHGVPTMGLGGVWSWQSKKQKTPLLDVFSRLNLKGRECFIIFDSDAVSNPDVRRAEYYFARALGALGAVVHIARLPAPDGAKVGLDDYILAAGAERLLTDVLALAQPFEENERLHAMNAEVCVVRNPGFVVRLQDQMPMSVMDFKGLHYATWQHTDYSGKDPRAVQTAEAWLRWPQRAEVARVAYAPGAPAITDAGALNTWAGWGAVPVRGPVPLWLQLLDQLFGDDPVALKWCTQWLAFPLQFPGRKQRNALVVWGRGKGTGKSLLGYCMSRIYGDNYVEIGDKDLDTNYAHNAWAKNRQFVLADDLTGHSNRALANKLNVMVTRTKLEINEKNLRQYWIADCINYYLTSNFPDVVHLDDGDRRYMIHEVPRDRLKLSEAYRKAFIPWINSAEGAGALFAHLLAVDLTDYDPDAAPPMTRAKAGMTVLSKTELELWVDGVMHDADALRPLGGGDLVTCDELVALFDGTGTRRDVTSTLMARKLTLAGAVRCAPVGSFDGQMRSRVRDKLVRLYAVRNLAEWEVATREQMIAHYDKHRVQFAKKERKF